MSELRIRSAALSDIGVDRTTNEDSLAVRLWPPPETGQPASRGLFVVADGVGGEAHGEVASAMACEALIAALEPALSRPDPGAISDDALKETVRDVSRQIEAEADSNPGRRGMSTTLTALMLTGRLGIVMHVGDSRAYWLNQKGAFQQITNDHVLQTAELGQAERESLGPGEVGDTVLTQALGEGPLEPWVKRWLLGARGRYLLCSDGLHAVVRDEELHQALTSAINVEDTARSLIDTANRRGGPDNISVIIADYVKIME
jgi:protein phosphatase